MDLRQRLTFEDLCVYHPQFPEYSLFPVLINSAQRTLFVLKLLIFQASK